MLTRRYRPRLLVSLVGVIFGKGKKNTLLHIVTVPVTIYAKRMRVLACPITLCLACTYNMPAD